MNKKRIHVGERIQDGAVIVSVSGDPIHHPGRGATPTHNNEPGKRGASHGSGRPFPRKRLGAAMLGELATGLKTTRNAGGDLKLSGVSRRSESPCRDETLALFQVCRDKR